MKDCKIIFNLIYLLYCHFRVPVSAIFNLAFSRTRVVSVSVLVQPRGEREGMREKENWRRDRGEGELQNQRLRASVS